MGKRLIIKTTLICLGIFLVLSSLIFAYVFKQYPLDLEQHIFVAVAAADIEEGTIIEEKQLMTKEIQLSASNTSLITDIGQAVGKKASVKIPKSDYVSMQDLISKEKWYKDDERIIILPVSIEDRLANLIKKGSYIDIRLKKEPSSVVETILYKIQVENILDETGTPLDLKTGANSKTAYMELVLDKEERQKIYSAVMAGKIIYELYCDNTQKP
jgi:hypothetical protein